MINIPNKNSPGCLARSRLTAFCVLLMCLQHNRKSAPAVKEQIV